MKTLNAPTTPGASLEQGARICVSSCADAMIHMGMLIEHARQMEANSADPAQAALHKAVVVEHAQKVAGLMATAGRICVGIAGALEDKPMVQAAHAAPHVSNAMRNMRDFKTPL